MARPKNTHSRRLAVMFKESEFANLEKLADRMMYSDKAEYYRMAGIDRRKK